MNDYKKSPLRKAPHEASPTESSGAPTSTASDTPRRSRPEHGNFDHAERTSHGERSFDRPRRDAGDSPRGERNFDRPRRDTGDSPRGERSFDRPRRDAGDFPQNEQGRDRAEWDKRPDRPRGAEGALIELDRDIMKLLVRRATLLSRIRGGKDHAATPSAVQAEKSVRLAWESAALSFSKDPRFTRQLFSLLQDIKVLAKEEAEGRGSFNLSPARLPVSGSLTAPSSSRAVLMWTALAAALGKPLALRPVLFSDDVVYGCKAFVHMGIDITQNISGLGSGEILIGPSKGFILKDAGIHAGDAPLPLYLIAFMAAGGHGTCRFTGGAAMKNADLSGLRHALPLLGARMAHVVPRSHGLPAIVECSGMIPEQVTIPGDLPLDGVCALLLAPLVWNVPVTLNLGELPAAIATAALAEVTPLHRECGASVESHGAALRYTPSAVTLPEAPALHCVPALDPALAAYLLALPAFTHGSVTLRGQWPAYLPQAVQAEALLEWAGITLAVSATSVTASRTSLSGKKHSSAPQCASPFFPATPLPAMELAPALSPLFFALTALLGKQCQSLPLPELLSFESENDDVIARDFFPRLGFLLDEGKIVPIQRQETAWVAPDAYWAMAFALSAYTVPDLQLANPKIVTSTFPPFWATYNALPNLADPAPPKAPQKERADDDKPARRRIIAD